VAAAAFAATVIIGFIVLPRDSSRWWLHGLGWRPALATYRKSCAHDLSPARDVTF
jgi:hypothetical protein